jgi:hypothetical protein
VMGLVVYNWKRICFLLKNNIKHLVWWFGSMAILILNASNYTRESS